MEASGTLVCPPYIPIVKSYRFLPVVVPRCLWTTEKAAIVRSRALRGKPCKEGEALPPPVTPSGIFEQGDGQGAPLPEPKYENG